MLNLYTSIVIITILSLLITIADAKSNQLITKERKQRIVVTCIVIMVCACCECIGVLTDGAASFFFYPHIAAKLIELMSTPFIGICVAASYGGIPEIKPALLVAVCHAAFQILAINFGWVFWVDSQNVYHRGELFIVYVIVFVLSIIYAFAAVIKNGKLIQTGVDIILVLAIAMIATGVIILLSTGIRITFLCITVGNILFYISYYKVMLQIDSITQLLNRRCYDVSLKDIGERAVYLLFDLDKFKHVNDTYGHAVGDICLRNVAKLLRKTYGSSGLCYRIGGDEFCVIMNNDLEKVEELNNQFTQAIERLRKEDERMPGVSIGYAYYDNATTNIQEIIEEADAMMYKNKG